MFGDTKIPKCSHYHNSRRHDFIQECPKDSKGCLTQFEGDNTYNKSLSVTSVQGVSVQNDKFEIMITVDLSYIRKLSWWFA